MADDRILIHAPEGTHAARWRRARIDGRVEGRAHLFLSGRTTALCGRDTEKAASGLPLELVDPATTARCANCTARLARYRHEPADRGTR